MYIMWCEPAQIFIITRYEKVTTDADQQSCSLKDLIFNGAGLVYAFILFPIDLRTMHPSVIITFARIIQVAIIIGVSYFIAIEQHGDASQKHTVCLHQQNFLDRQLNL